MRVTRSDIAKKAGVSTATVSYVLNGSNRVGEETRQRVQKIIDEYNYRPDLIARSLAMKNTMQIGLMVNDLFNNFFADIVTEFEKAAMEAGYCVNICTSEKNLAAYIDNFVARRMDGVFCMISPTRLDMQQMYSLEEYEIPVLMSGNPTVDTGKVSLIEPDYAQGMAQIVDYLKGYGHSRIAFLSAFPLDFECDIRAREFIKAYDRRFERDEKILITGTYPFYSTVEAGYELAEQLLRQGREFTAVVTTNDSMAIGCMEALAKHGLRVPEDVSVMGIDNISTGKHLAVPLTTIGFDKRQFANEAFALLQQAMTTGQTSEKKILMYITERKSVAAVRR